MKRLAAVALACLTLTGFALAGGTTPSLLTASGTLVKVEKDSLTLQPRSEGGKFAKNLVLKLTGTSTLSSLSQRKKGGKLVLVQTEIKAKDLQPNQHLAVIYSEGKEGAVLLSAIALKAPAK